MSGSVARWSAYSPGPSSLTIESDRVGEPRRIGLRGARRGTRDERLRVGLGRQLRAVASPASSTMRSQRFGFAHDAADRRHARAARGSARSRRSPRSSRSSISSRARFLCCDLEVDDLAVLHRRGAPRSSRSRARRARGAARAAAARPRPAASAASAIAWPPCGALAVALEPRADVARRRASPG